tara:strand:- start:33 stop:329 length:297 start_codon:yes stop_codon:yes gene_type:complete
MRFFLSPFIFLFELIGFLISAAFLYGLALIGAGIFIWYTLSTIPNLEPEEVIVYKDRIVKEYVPIVEKKEKSLVCEKFNGCEFHYENGKEICPDCVLK